VVILFNVSFIILFIIYNVLGDFILNFLGTILTSGIYSKFICRFSNRITIIFNNFNVVNKNKTNI